MKVDSGFQKLLSSWTLASSSLGNRVFLGNLIFRAFLSSMLILQLICLDSNVQSTLEHMLFMGSEKYPDENAYEKFLSDVRPATLMPALCACFVS